MIEQFKALMAGFESLFSKDYVMEGLLPIFLILVGTFALWAPGDPLLLRLLLSVGGPSFSWNFVPFAFFLLFGWASLSWVWWAANPWFRKVLEGDLPLIRSLLQPLEGHRLLEWEDTIRAAEAEWVRFRGASDNANPGTLGGRLVEARVQGSQLPPRGASTRLKRGLRKLRRDLAKATLTPFNLFESVAADLRADLKAGNANANTIQARTLDEAHRDFEILLQQGEEKANAILGERSARRFFRFPPAGLGANELSNRIRAQEALTYNSYQFDPRAFLPHILLTVIADEKLTLRLVESSRFLGTSVAFCMAFGVLTAETLFIATLPFRWAVVAWTICPIGVYAFYRIATLAATALGENVRAIVDLKRFDLLKALHVTLPNNAVAERQIWTDLSRQLVAEDYAAANVTYHHP